MFWSAGVSTMHSRPGSRLGLAQVAQTSSSVKLLQRAQWRRCCTAAESARPSMSAPCRSCCSR
ncbi:Uncharacterised protein [Bordetella pertussis]|nr:Uncharacterised protein [Bordetella pertussis]